MKTFIMIALLVIGFGWFVGVSYQAAHDKANLGYNGHTLTNLPVSAPVYTAPQTQTHDVVYKLTLAQSGCHSIDATYEMPSGTAQKTVTACSDSPLPAVIQQQSLTVDSRPAQSGDSLYLSVQNDGHWATIGCQIFVDGRLAYQTKSTGEYVVASCSGRIG